MHKMLKGAILGALVPVLLFSHSAIARSDAGDSAISAAVEKVMAADQTVDVTALRQKNAKRFSYFLPDWKEAAAAFDSFDKAPEQAFSLAQRQLQINPLDIDANYLAEAAAQKLGRPAEEIRYHTLLMAMLHSISGGNNGKTTGSPWNAVSVAEEYQILRLVGLKVKQQALVIEHGHQFDAMTVEGRKPGEEFTINFNIDFFFSKQF